MSKLRSKRSPRKRHDRRQPQMQAPDRPHSKASGMVLAIAEVLAGVNAESADRASIAVERSGVMFKDDGHGRPVPCSEMTMMIVTLKPDAVKLFDLPMAAERFKTSPAELAAAWDKAFPHAAELRRMEASRAAAAGPMGSATA